MHACRSTLEDPTNAALQSGWLELCVVGRMSRLSFLAAFPRVFRGTHVTHPDVTMLRAREVAISADGPRSANAPQTVLGDGELVGTLPVSFRVLPAALSVIADPSVGLD